MKLNESWGHVKPLETMLGVSFTSNRGKLPNFVYHVNGIFSSIVYPLVSSLHKNETNLEHSFNWFLSSLKTVRWCSAYFSFFVLWLKHEKWFELSLLIFRALDSNMKKVNGTLFKIFLGSLNMKRLSSDLVFFMLVKLFEESSIRW